MARNQGYVGFTKRAGRLLTMIKRIETITNVVTIVVMVIFGYALLKIFVFAPKTVVPVGPRSGVVLPAVEHVSWSSDKSTLILALRSGCEFCRESVPFYKELHSLQAKNAIDARIMVVVPDAPGVAREFKESEGLPFDVIPEVPFSKLGVSGTPTLILVDSHGRVVQSWVGLLSPTKEEQVLAAIASVPGKVSSAAAATATGGN